MHQSQQRLWLQNELDSCGWVMANLLDGICDDGPVLSARLSRPKGITKRQVERCIHELSEHWSDEQLNDVIDMFQAHGLL